MTAPRPRNGYPTVGGACISEAYVAGGRPADPESDNDQHYERFIAGGARLSRVLRDESTRTAVIGEANGRLRVVSGRIVNGRPQYTVQLDPEPPTSSQGVAQAQSLTQAEAEGQPSEPMVTNLPVAPGGMTLSPGWCAPSEVYGLTRASGSSNRQISIRVRDLNSSLISTLTGSRSGRASARVSEPETSSAIESPEMGS